MTSILILIAIVMAVPGVLTSLHLTLLTLAALLYRPPRPAQVDEVRFLIMIPAHNEELVLEATLRAIELDRRPQDRVLVVADRCTDGTAPIARSYGAIVLERALDDEPGRAATRQAGLELARTLEWDAIVMIDADSVIEPGFFAACEQALASGAPALQARSEGAHDDRLVAQATVASFAMQGITIPRGRDRLGLAVRLRGTGMVLRRDICERFAFRAPASEDLYYSLDLCLAGYRPRHVERARLRSENVGSWRGASAQKRRYEAGRMSAAREFVRPLLRRHDRASLEAAWFLLSPPYAIALASLLVAALVAWPAGLTPLTVALLAFAGLLALDLLVALLLARAPWRTWVALAIAPWYLAWKLVVQAKALGSVVRGERDYGPTARRDEVVR